MESLDRSGISSKTYELVQADAFTSQPLEGNACAVLTDARGLDDATMQRIARENNLSETSFVLPSTQADFRARYFTPTSELPLAGHPTIATAHVLRELGRIAPGVESFTLELKAGVITVRVERTGSAIRYVMRQLKPSYMQTYGREAYARALGLEASDLIDQAPQTVSTGAPQLMIGLRDPALLANCEPKRELLFPPDAKTDYFSVHVFARDGRDGIALRSRHFVDFGGIVEDPFTGSATGGMAAFCARYGIVAETSYAVAQGEHCGRPGIGYVTVLGNRAAPDAIEVGGEAVTVLRGTLFL